VRACPSSNALRLCALRKHIQPQIIILHTPIDIAFCGKAPGLLIAGAYGQTRAPRGSLECQLLRSIPFDEA